MLDSLNLAIIDVETTGSSASYDRIIEIGAHRVERGRLVDTYSTLVNPGCLISPMITQITGINDSDVADAPAFSEIARRLHRLIQGCVFVAHNVHFDYGFLRSEFERAGIHYTAELLCSVRLSRLLYPRHKRHSLSALIERFEFPCANRHRALDDATVVWAFFQHIQSQLEPQKVKRAVRQLLKAPPLPPRLSAKDIEALPAGQGVYIFYDEKHNPLYVGKSAQVRERVLSHFSSESGKEKQLRRQIASIEAHPTYGRLGSLLLEAHVIERLLLQRAGRGRGAKKSRMPVWPFSGMAVVEEKNYSGANGHLFVVDQWRLIKALRYENDASSPWFALEARSNDDLREAIAKYMLAHPRNVRPLSQEAAQTLLEGDLEPCAGL